MTTIAAIAHEGRLVMAADTMTNVYDRPIYTARKVTRIAVGDGAGLVGVAGSGSMIGLVADLKLPEDLPDDPDDVAHQVALAITQLAVDRGIVENGQMDSTVLFGFRGRLWTLTHAQAIAHDPQVAALGSGEGPAMGAMMALMDGDFDPFHVAWSAVQIGIALDRYSGGTVLAEVLEPST